MKINDIFSICNISFTYNIQLDMMSPVFTDLLTGLPLFLTPVQLMTIDNILQSYSETDLQIATICIKGKFVRDSQFLYVQKIDDLYFIELKAITAYIDYINNTGIIKDVLTNMPISLDGITSEETDDFSKYINTLTTQYSYDFSIDGTDRLTLLAKVSNIDNDIITVDFSNNCLLDSTPSIIRKMYDILQEGKL